MAGAHSGGWCVWQAHIAVAGACGRRTYWWLVRVAGAHTGGWCVWQAHIAVAAATGRRTWRWQVEWQLPLPRKDFTLTAPLLRLGARDVSRE